MACPSGRRSRARRESYQRVLRANSLDRDALLGLAAVEARTQNYEGAESHYLRVLELDPRDAYAQAGLLALRGLSDPVQSESRLKNLLAHQPDATFVHFSLGNQYAAQGRWPDAQAAYFRAFSTDPENADYAFNLAVSLDHLRQPRARARVLPPGSRACREPRGGIQWRPSRSENPRTDALTGTTRSMNSPASPQAKRHIGQILISQGILTEDQLRIALLEQLKSRQPVGKLLVQLGFVSEATLRDALSEKLGLQSVDLSQIVVDPGSIRIVPREFAKRHNLFPVALDKERKRLILAISDTNNIVALDQVRAQLRGEFEVELRLAGESEIARAIDQFYGYELSVDGILKEIETGEIDYESLQAGGDEYTQPMVRLVNALLVDAVKRGASDIHFEPERASCASATGSTACCARSAACTRPTGRRSRCGSR